MIKRYIVSKSMSDEFLACSGVNTIIEKVFDSNSTLQDVCKFLNSYDCDLYTMRDKSNIGSVHFIYGATKGEVIRNISNFRGKFSIFESLSNYDKNNLVLQGEIFVGSDMGVIASLDNRKAISNREAMLKPSYNFKFSLMERKEPRLQGFSYVLNYIFEYSLIDLVVEFSLYNVKVGKNRENIIIWEVRNY